MSDIFLPFDAARVRAAEALGDLKLPEHSPPVYLLRNLHGGVRLAVSESAEPDQNLSPALERLGRALTRTLGPYGPPEGAPVLWLSDFLVDRLKETARPFIPGVFWADRVMVGTGWWTVDDKRGESTPARYTLYSVKGGVGRSTTAAVLARHLASKGANVLVLDLDLESPGLASTVLPRRQQPTFGVTDWFVEDLVGQGDRVLDDMTGSPQWAADLPGDVRIAPAHGREPGEYLAKLGRVYVEAWTDPWPDRLNRLVTRLEQEFKTDAVLVESRSGLHDIAAATVTSLDAEVLMFGVDSPSTWSGYGILFDHWREQGLAAAIRDRLSIVSALTPEKDSRAYTDRFREQAWHLFRDRLYDRLSGSDPCARDAESHDLMAPEASHYPMVIRWHRGLAGGTDLRNFDDSAVEQAYAPFLSSFDRRFGTNRRRTLLRPVEDASGPRLKTQAMAGIPRVSTTLSGEANASDADVETLQFAFRELPDGISHGEPVSPSQAFLPPSHRKALAPNVGVVTGMRGAGKTFWWSALQNPAVRALLGGAGAPRALGRRTVVRAGFGVQEDHGAYPTQAELRRLVSAGVEPSTIWRTVHALSLVGSEHQLAALDSWSERVRSVQENPRPISGLFRDRDRAMHEADSYSIVLFDGLDRAAAAWEDTFRLIRGLLQHALDMRSYRRLRTKVFLRTDQFVKDRIAGFPDASKMLADAVELTWPRRDLYGMLWQSLANGPRGSLVRGLLAAGDWDPLDIDAELIYRVPSLLASDEATQRDRFHEIAGPWMGTDRRRGLPYSWIPNHLADATGSVSPRSFIRALRAAADDTARRHPAHKYALHYDSIKRGVREASKIRVGELREDYPWVGRLLGPLSATVVPCDFSEVAQTWTREGVIEKLSEAADTVDMRLPPRRIDGGPPGIRRDLEALGVFRRLHDGRVDIPDVFRLGYGIGRRGGVRPVK